MGRPGHEHGQGLCSLLFLAQHQAEGPARSRAQGLTSDWPGRKPGAVLALRATMHALWGSPGCVQPHGCACIYMCVHTCMCVCTK